MSFFDGYLSLCSAVGTGTATEVAGVVRVPMSFSVPKNGVSVNTRSWNFGAGYYLTGPYAGRALYDAPTGGRLLLVMPFYAPRAQPGSGPADNGDVADINLLITALAGYPDASAYTGTLTASTAIGTTWDAKEVLSTVAVLPTNLSGYTTLTNASPLSVGPATLNVARGVVS
jgi:hypothetical protein